MQDGIGNTVSLIEAFERTTRRFPQRTCFTFVEDDGAEVAYSYREVRMLAAALAFGALAERAVPGDMLASFDALSAYIGGEFAAVYATPILVGVIVLTVAGALVQSHQE